VAGNVVVVATYKTGHPSGTIAAFVALNIAILVVMLRHVREPQPARQRSAFVLAEFLRQFYVDPRAHTNFYWVLVTRLLVGRVSQNDGSGWSDRFALSFVYALSFV
jgi:hypothetical protein